ncbi:MAG: RNase adapter RapZ [Pseudomonadales bacterium]
MLVSKEEKATRAKPAQLAIISGRSGSGKSTALHMLEDAGYYCIDNLPAGLLPELVKQSLIGEASASRSVAVSIDARNIQSDLSRFEELIFSLPANIRTEVIYLDTNSDELIKRFSETRRKHPLSNADRPLREAIEAERVLLQPIADVATLMIDTSNMNIYELRDIIKKRVIGEVGEALAILFQSFGFKRGIPHDADLVYDVRCLPNPYWEQNLRGLSGQDAEVIEYLDQYDDVNEMFLDIRNYLEKWLPSFEKNNRSYITIAIGCTGGQHRSVYMCERLNKHFALRHSNVQIRHRELSN